MKKLSHDAIKELLPEKFRLMADTSPAMDDLIYDLNKSVGVTDVLVFSGEAGTGKKTIADALFRFHSDEDYKRYYCHDITFDEFLYTTIQLYRSAFSSELISGSKFLLIEGVNRLKRTNQLRLLLFLKKYIKEKKRKNIFRGIIIIEEVLKFDLIKKQYFSLDAKLKCGIEKISFLSVRQTLREFGIILTSLIIYFNRKLSRRIQYVDSKTIVTMSFYHWPGNLNELESIVYRGFILDQDDTLILADWVKEKACEYQLGDHFMLLMENQRSSIEELRFKFKETLIQLSSAIPKLKEHSWL